MISLLFLLLTLSALDAAEPANETMVVRDGRTGKTTVQNGRRARARLTPCSTYKIPNSLIALETGVASDGAFVIEYDPKRDGPQNGAWARDLDLRSAVRYSALRYFREIARRVGAERMQAYLDRFDYGNRSIAGGIDGFWVGGGLRISAEEQLEFLRKFREGRLPASSRNLAAVKQLILLETTPQYRWYGKTGTCTDPDYGPVAWHVGFVERQGEASYYAWNFGGKSVGEVFALRSKLLREKLSSLGLIDAQAPTARQQMETKISTAIRSFAGSVSLFALNLDTGAHFGIREDEKVRTASTIKLPIMTAVYAAVAQGKTRWDESIELRAAQKVSGSGVLAEFSDGVRLPLRDLVHLMIVVSDNTATNLILDRLTADFVNAELERFGLHTTRSLRKIGAPGSERFGIGVSTPREMVALLEKLERGQVVNPDASKEMLAILKRQQDKDGIGRQLPGRQVASKSGALDRLRSDAGIVYSVGGRIAVAITVDDILRTDYSPENAGKVLISELTGMLLEGLATPIAELGAPEQVIELKAAMDHVQGIAVDGTRLWVTWVDRKLKTGHLGEFELATGKLLRSIPVHRGDQYHPGGLSAEGDSLWLPVAEYRPRSSSTIEKRSKQTLELETEFEVTDHIGCVAVSSGRIYGGNWDSREIYQWDLTGRLMQKLDNTSGTSFQDMKAATDALVGGGLRPDGGSIDWLDPQDLRLKRRIRVGKTSRGVMLTHEGMAVSGDRLYLLPEDSPSRLFVFNLPQ